MAENWIQFAKSAVAKNLQFQDQWLDIQRQQLDQDQAAGQQRVEMTKLQLQIEQLRQENLRLERENLEMRMRLNGQGAEPEANQPAAGKPNEPAGAGSTSGPATQTPPAKPR